TVFRLPVEHRRGSFWRYVWEYALFFVLATLTVTLLHVRKHFRVVEVDNMPDVLVFSAIVPRLSGARVILYIFDNMPELLVVARGYSHRHPLVWLLAWLERVSSSFADRVIVTQEMAREVVCARGCPEEKLAVLLNCPTESVFALAKRFGDRARDCVSNIVSHGSLLERYGIQVLVDALPSIADKIPGVQLQVCGGGEYRQALEQ